MAGIEVYERRHRRRELLGLLKELLSIIALAMIITLAFLMIRAALAEDAALAEIDGLRDRAAMLSEAIDATIADLVAETRGPVPEIETPGPAPEGPAFDPVDGISTEERDLLERVVMAEAGNQSYEGRIAAAEVVLNRSELWGMTITEVINAPGQFCEPYRGEVSGDVKRAVTDALAGIRVFRDPVTHFHNAGVTPAWASAKTLAGQIGDHKFYH
jgi:N-acetylmuramoyl-L-alanine amidase